MRVIVASLSFAALALAVAIASSPQSDPSAQFYQAIRSNDLVALKDLIKAKGTNATDEDGNTPLMVAALDGTPEAMKMLLDAGSDPNQPNTAKATPLVWCAGDPAKVRLLLDHKADVNLATPDGTTPLDIACDYDNSAESVKLLLTKGAKVNALTAPGQSALELACAMNNLNAAKLLIAQGADVHLQDKSHTDALIAAAANGHRSVELVRYLLAHGASPKGVTADVGGTVLNGPLAIGHFTALHMAAQLNVDATKALIDAGADINAKDVRGGTPLDFAVATDHPILPAIKALLAHGAQTGDAVAWAKRYNNPKVLALLGTSAAPISADASVPADPTWSKENVRLAISRALAVSQPSAAKFFKAGGCVSCHSQAWTGISVMSAPSSLYTAECRREADQTQLTEGGTHLLYPGIALLEDPGGSADTVSMLLMQLSASQRPSSLATDAFVHYICAAQHREGCWPEGGYPRPPMQDGDLSITTRAIKALRAYEIPALKPEIDERIERACRWIAELRPETNIDRAERILGWEWAGKTAPASWAKALEAKQRPNGGWGQTDGLPADAFATGQALMALRATGVQCTDKVYAKGVKFLLATQQQEGVWHVTTRAFGFQPYFQSGFPYDHDQWISQAGTALAVIALDEAAK